MFRLRQAVAATAARQAVTQGRQAQGRVVVVVGVQGMRIRLPVGANSCHCPPAYATPHAWMSTGSRPLRDEDDDDYYDDRHDSDSHLEYHGDKNRKQQSRDFRPLHSSSSSGDSGKHDKNKRSDPSDISDLRAAFVAAESVHHKMEPKRQREEEEGQRRREWQQDYRNVKERYPLYNRPSGYQRLNPAARRQRRQRRRRRQEEEEEEEEEEAFLFPNRRIAPRRDGEASAYARLPSLTNNNKDKTPRSGAQALRERTHQARKMRLKQREGSLCVVEGTMELLRSVTRRTTVPSSFSSPPPSSSPPKSRVKELELLFQETRINTSRTNAASPVLVVKEEVVEKQEEVVEKQEKDEEHDDELAKARRAATTTTITIAPKPRRAQQATTTTKAAPVAAAAVEEDLTVMLPPSGTLTLLDLSQQLGVKVETLVQALRAIGEDAPQDGSRRKGSGHRRSRQEAGWRDDEMDYYDEGYDDGDSETKRKSKKKLKKMMMMQKNKDNKAMTAKKPKSLEDKKREVPAPQFVVSVHVAELLCLELGFEPQRRQGAEWQQDVERAEMAMRRQATAAPHCDGLTMQPRPPVVCIMGHVDHGKTTLMDALRQRAAAAVVAAEQNGGSGGPEAKTTSKKTKKKKKNGKSPKQQQEVEGAIAGTEAGGITQVISAFEVPLVLMDDDDEEEEELPATVTFLDTPGHAAFRSMRQSGSHGADVICLVIAADDGVSAQTIEILDMYKSIAAESQDVSLVVAMTKIDKPQVQVKEAQEGLERQLWQHEISDVAILPVSGLTGEGLNDFVEHLVLQAQVMELQSVVDKPVEGIIMDARLEPGVGIVVDAIVRSGTIAKGNVVVSGTHVGKVRLLHPVSGKDHATTTWNKAGPSQPVRIVGFKTLPKAGDPLLGVESEEVAKEIVEHRLALQGSDSTARAPSSEDAELQVLGVEAKQAAMLQHLKQSYGLLDSNLEDGDSDGRPVRIPVVVKADANGSLEAVQTALLAIGEESKWDVTIDIIEKDIGPVSAFDVRMAQSSGAAIFCFGSATTSSSSSGTAIGAMAEEAGVKIRHANVIYHLLDEAKRVFETYLPPQPVQVVHGQATVKAVFELNTNGRRGRRHVIAGLEVTEGRFSLHSTTCAMTGTKMPVFFRIVRGGKVWKNAAAAESLRRVKEEVELVKRGEECGLGLQDYDDFEEGDVIECFSTRMEARQL